ncbi:kinase-like protein [Hypoxylon rubiginosum]|uniref:Kinase-like protein n=1 Tax=Hypoxylon rubiginosum TaxID=110542 RepID=A0ACC0D2V3_9PEZI|nr:kinase-like protein [Hypoxylon rubiginosum]
MRGPSCDHIDYRAFGPLVDISEESLILLATDFRKRCFNKSTSESKYICRKNGSFNLVHIVQLDDFKLVIRIPVTGWGSGKTEKAAHAMESQVDTLRLIAQGTTIPVPEIYDFDTTDDNVIGTPYMCMSFMPGNPVSDVWFKEPEDFIIQNNFMKRKYINTTREQFRLKILKSLAQFMSQLSRFTFDKIGSISNRSSTPAASDPCYHWRETLDGTMKIVTSGPFDSASAYLEYHDVHDIHEHELVNAQAKILKHMLAASPINDIRGSFVLRPPDFNLQNVMVDEEGNVTGLIDWDFAQTVPHCIGYAAYPAWIRRDWDPATYGWPTLRDSEDSPERLERYRAFYNEEMGKALNWKGDWRFTKKSHITTSIWHAFHDEISSLELCRMLVQEVIDVEDNEDALDILYDIGAEEFEGWDHLRDHLKEIARIKP